LQRRGHPAQPTAPALATAGVDDDLGGDLILDDAVFSADLVEHDEVRGR
jgi:hypothetical protein